MKTKHIDQWIKKIPQTQADEISCSECFDLLSQYVDVELAAGEAKGQLLQVQQHLRHCPTCHEEYITLHDLQQLENSGNPPSVDELKRSIH